jgi:SAM-dependent methyltransferase
MSDPLGNALTDFWHGDKEATLLVYTSYGEIEAMPASVFFRNKTQMPDIELYMLDLCKGKILDAGAGAGSHSLLLQERGLSVCALDISPLAVQVMHNRGVQHAICGDIFTFTHSPFDTILLAMNGVGIAKNLSQVKILLLHLKTLLKPGGQLLLDSCDVSYLEETNISAGYVGEVTFQFEYKGQKGEPFEWIYINIPTLKRIATRTGWQCQIIYQESEAYAARLMLL